MGLIQVVPESQTGMEGISCLTCSVNSSGLETNTDHIFTKQWMHPWDLIYSALWHFTCTLIYLLYVCSPLDDKLDLTTSSQDLAQFGCSETVGSAQRDSLWQPADVQILRVHLEPGVGHLGWFREAQSFSWRKKRRQKHKKHQTNVIHVI